MAYWRAPAAQLGALHLGRLARERGWTKTWSAGRSPPARVLPPSLVVESTRSGLCRALSNSAIECR